VVPSDEDLGFVGPGELAELAEARVLELWDEVDVMMTPALASTAIAAERWRSRPASGPTASR
jgi:hypothetical protein